MDFLGYSILIKWSEEDDAYIGLIKEFPYLSAFGDTATQAKEELKTVLSLAVEVYEENGWKLPEPKNDWLSKASPNFMRMGFWEEIDFLDYYPW